MVLKELFARLGLDLDAQSFVKGQLAVEGIKLAVVGLATVAARVASAFPNMVESTVEAADKFDEAAQATGMNASALQELTYAAGFSGLALESLSGALGIMAKNAGAARDGNEQLQKSFSKVGVSLADLRDSSPDELLMQIADVIADMPDGMEKTALSMELFGKSGKQLIPFLNAGADGIGELREEARQLGIVMGDDVLKAGAGVDDEMTKLKATLTGLKYDVIGPLLPDIKNLVHEFVEWWRTNKDLIKQRIEKVLHAIGLAARVLWRVMTVLGRAIGFVIDNFKLLSIILGSVIAVALVRDAILFWKLGLSAVQAGLSMLVAGVQAAAAWIAAAAPVIAIAALIALVILIVEDLWVALNGGDSLIGNLMEKWSQFLATWLEDTDGDPWWLVAIKALIWEVTHLDEVWDEAVTYWRALFQSFFDWLDEKLAGVYDFIDAITDFDFGNKSPEKEKAFFDGYGITPQSLGLSPSTVAGIASGSPARAFGGGASPMASAAARGSAPAGAGTTISNSISVTAKTREDADAIGKSLTGVLEDWWEGKMGAAAAAMGGG